MVKAQPTYVVTQYGLTTCTYNYGQGTTFDMVSVKHKVPNMRLQCVFIARFFTMRPKKPPHHSFGPATLSEFITSRLFTVIKQHSVVSLVGRHRTDRVMKEYQYVIGQWLSLLYVIKFLP
jgi:hypothetical protein